MKYLVLILFIIYPSMCIAACELPTSSSKSGFRELSPQYKHIIFNLLDEVETGSTEQFDKCEKKYANDRYLKFVISYIRIEKGEDGRSVFKGISMTNDTISDIWEVDRILRFDYSEPHPKVFDSYTLFSELYVTALFKLVKKGDAEAVDVFFKIYSVADGEVAELMANQIFELLRDYPTAVISNWMLIKKYSGIIGLESTDFNSEIAKEMVGKYNELCEKNNSKVCKEIIEFIETISP